MGWYIFCYNGYQVDYAGFGAAEEGASRRPWRGDCFISPIRGNGGLPR
jgi:hypothetical protein